MKNKKIFILSAFSAALAGLLFGFDTAVIAGTTKAMTQVFDLSASSLGLTVSIALWGTITGAIGAGFVADKLGRRESLKYMGLLFLISALGCAFCWDWFSLVAFRFIGGLGVGGASVIAPMYIAEISPPSLRGRMVGLFQFSIVFGILTAYFSNFFIGTLGFEMLEWRIKFGVEVLPALIFISLLFTIPQSPRWLISRSKTDEALNVLKMISPENAKEQCDEIVKSLNNQDNKEKERFFSYKYSFAIFVAFSIAMFNQLSGINALLYYLTDIFSMAGFDKMSADLQSVSIGATNLIFTVLAMSIIDKIGRKKLLLIGSVGTALCLGGVGSIFLLGSHKELLLPLLIGYIAFFAFSQGAVIWVYLSEIFPNSVRAKGQSLGSVTHWLMCAIISFAFPVMAESSGGYPFIFFAFMMVIQFFVVLMFYPETKGVSLEDLEKTMILKKPQSEMVEAELN